VFFVLMVAALGTAVFLVPENGTAQVLLTVFALALGLYAPYVYVFARNEAANPDYRDPTQDEAERHCGDCGERFVVAAYEPLDCPACGARSHGVSGCEPHHG
jgi:hypothetical protein